MADTFNLEAYRCTYLPGTLWRVIHSNTQSSEDPETRDHVASDSTRMIHDESSLKKAAENHFDWY